MNTKLSLLPIFTICAVLLSGCAGNQTQIMQQADFYGVPKPGQVFVGQFAFAANDPNPDQSILNRMNNQFVPTTPQTPEDQAGQSVAVTMQNALMKDLSHEGIPAIPTLNNVVPQVGSLIIEGELLTAKDAGSFQRLSPGLASGQAKVVSYVSVYLVTTKGVNSFAKFYSDTKGTTAPEVATTLTVGSAASGVADSVSTNSNTITTRGQSAQADAKLIAKQIAKKMGKLFKAESWSSVNSPN